MGQSFLAKMILAQLLNNSPVFYGTQKFIAVFTTARQIHSVTPLPQCTYYAVAQLVEALHYEPEGRGFHS
jgi:hypothetical protein